MTTERHPLLREVRPNSIRIKLHSAIGQGLSSHVYRGVREDSRGFTRQQVAVKITKSAGEADVLRREFETLLQVQSPHLVRVYAWDDHGDESMLSMEYIDGVDLQKLLESDRLDEKMVEEIITQVQEGLRALAAKNLEHGDLSPGNILVDRQGLVKLIDFANPCRGSGFVHGTPPYIAPEVWRGYSTSIESDLFALGVLHHDLLARVHDKGYLVPQANAAAKNRCLQLSQSQPDHPWLSHFPRRRRFVERQSSEEARFCLGQLVRMTQRLQLEPKTMSPQLSLDSWPSSYLESDEGPSFHAEMTEKGTEYHSKKGGTSALQLIFYFGIALVFLVLCIAVAQIHTRRPWILDHSHAFISAGPARPISPRTPYLERETVHLEPVELDFSGLPVQARPSVLQLLPATAPATSMANLREAGSLQIRTHRWMHFWLNQRDIGYAPIHLGHLSPGIYRLKWRSNSNSGVKSIQIRAARQTRCKEDDFKAAVRAEHIDPASRSRRKSLK